MKLKSLLTASLAASALAASSAASSAFGADRIEFWTMNFKPKLTSFMQDLSRKYEAQNPDVKVEWIDYPWDTIRTKLVASIGSGKPPALVIMNVPWAEEYAGTGLIMPVDSLMGSARSGYAKGAIDDVTFKGKIYGFPYYSNVDIIAYNTKLFQAAELSGAPKNLDDELAFARQLHAKTGKAGYAPTLGKPDGFFLQQGLPVIKDGKAVFNSSKHVALIEKLAAAYKDGSLLKDNLFIEDNFPTAIAAYKGSRLGMLIAPPIAIKHIQADAKDIYAITDVSAAPVGPTGIADGGWLFHFVVPTGNDPKLIPAIGKFALYLTNDENQLEFAKAAGVFPTMLKAGKDAYFQSLPPNAGAFEKAVAAAANSMKHSRTLYLPGVPDYDEMRRVLVKAVEGGVTGKKDAKLALDEAVEVWNKKLAK